MASQGGAQGLAPCAGIVLPFQKTVVHQEQVGRLGLWGSLIAGLAPSTSPSPYSLDDDGIWESGVCQRGVLSLPWWNRIQKVPDVCMLGISLFPTNLPPSRLKTTLTHVCCSAQSWQKNSHTT